MRAEVAKVHTNSSLKWKHRYVCKNVRLVEVEVLVKPLYSRKRNLLRKLTFSNRSVKKPRK